MLFSGRRLLALLAVAVAAGSPVVPQASAAYPPLEVVAVMPPEFSGTVSIDWNMTALHEDPETGYPLTRHSDGRAVLEVASGDTIGFDPYLFFRVRELSGVDTRTVVGPDGPVVGDCDQTVTYSPPGSTDNAENASNMVWYTPDDASPWAAWGFRRPIVVVSTAFPDPDCGPSRGLDVLRPFEMAASPAFGYPPALVTHNTDSAGGRMHLVGSEHYDLNTPWVAEWNSFADPEHPADYYTAYDVIVSFDLRRIARGSKFAQYPTMKLSNDAQGRDVIRLQTRQPVPRVRFWLVTRKAGSPLSTTVGKLRADERGRKKVVLPDPKPSKATCYQIEILDNLVTLPGQTWVECVK